MEEPLVRLQFSVVKANIVIIEPRNYKKTNYKKKVAELDILLCRTHEKIQESNIIMESHVQRYHS